MRKCRVFLVLASIIVLLPFVLHIKTAYAEGLPGIFIPPGTKEKATREQYRTILRTCFSNVFDSYEKYKESAFNADYPFSHAMIEVKDKDDKHKLIPIRFAVGTTGISGEDGYYNCTQLSRDQVINMFNTIEFRGRTIREIYCNMSGVVVSKDKRDEECSKETGDLTLNLKKIRDAINSKPGISKETKYYIAYQLISQQCEATNKGILGKDILAANLGENDYRIVVALDPRDGKESETYVFTLGDKDHDIALWNREVETIDEYTEYINVTSCKALISQRMVGTGDDLVNPYLQYVKEHLPGSTGVAGTCDERYDPEKNKEENAACVDGFNNKGVDGYCDKTYPYDLLKGSSGSSPGSGTSTASPDKLNRACHYGAETATSATGKTQGEQLQPDGEGQKTCAIDGIGWLICPVVTFLAQVSDTVKDNIDEYLVFNPSELTKRDDGSVYSYWATMRNYANVLFVIAFIIIIYSQISGMGLSTYGIKRMLPRLVVGALLVNVSFYLCAAMVDLSNAIGASAYNFISSGTSAGSGGASPSSSASGDAWWATTATTLLVGGAVLFFALGAFIAGLITVLMIALTTLLLLGVRQAIIIFAIIISPLAFVAWLLPNTESLFKKWWQTFKTMLFVYPIIGIIYGASTLASNIIRNQYGGTDGSSVAMQIVAAVLMFVPLLLVPKVLNTAMSIGNIAAITGGIIKGKAGGFLGGAVKAKVGKPGSRFGNYRKMKKERRNAQIRAGVYEGKHPIRRLKSGANRIFNQSRISGGYGDMRAAEGTKEAAHQDHERMEMAEARINNMKVGGAYLNQQQLMEAATTGKVGDTKLSSYEQRAAIKKAAAMGTSKDALELAESSTNPEMDATVRKEIADALAQSGAGERSPYLGGAALADIQAGTFNKDDAIRKAATKGKITAESLSKADEFSAGQIAQSLSAAAQSDEYKNNMTAKAGENEIVDAVRNAKAAARGLKNSDKLMANVRGNRALEAQIHNISKLGVNSQHPRTSSSTPPPPPPPPAPAPPPPPRP